MYYNIKIKTLKGEYSLESSEKDIIQREMDLYFASMYQASDEFKANIKELNISHSNHDINNEVEQLKNFRKNVIENDSNATLDDFLSETIKEKNKKEDIKTEEPIGFISFKNEAKEIKENVSGFKFDFKKEYENVNKEAEKEEENPNQAQNELEELKEMQISLIPEYQTKEENIIQNDLNPEEKIDILPDVTEVKKEGAFNTNQTISFLKQPEPVSEIDYFTKDTFKKAEEANFIENTNITEVKPEQNEEKIVETEEKPKEETFSANQTISFLKQPEPVSEIDYFTKDKPKKLERINFIEKTNITEVKPEQNEEKTIKTEEKPKEENNISKILNTAKNDINLLDIASNEIDGDLLDVFEDNNYDVIEFSEERIRSIKKENENKEEVINLTENTDKENDIQKDLINEYTPKQDENIEFDVIDVSDSMVHYENLNTLSEEKPFETFERKELEEGDNIISLNDINQTVLNNEEKDIQIQNTEQIPVENKKTPQEQTVNNTLAQTPQNTDTPIDFKTYLADFIAEDIVDKFLICAYYIKNNLHEESFTIKSLNAKFFPATGELANMDVVNELLEKNYITYLKSDTPKKTYTISPEGEKYFLENIQI